MLDGTLIRLFRFRSVRPAFDEMLRTDLIPDLCAQAGMLGCWSARQGPDELGPRVVVSIWEAASSAGATLDPASDQFDRRYLDETTERTSELHPVRLFARFPVDGESRILRLFRGRVRPGELDAYEEDLRHGMAADASGPSGPTAICMAETGPDDFLTVSAWRDWRDIEASTGGDVHRPRATRRPDRLVDWDVSHFEIVGLA
jgi:hypothetical protein